MANQFLKRQFDDLNSNNDDLNDDEFDVTWGGKRSRYIYNYTLQPDLFSNENDTDETESVYSYQTKSTAAIESEEDLPSGSSCGSDCDCQHSNQLNREEFDVRSLSASSHNIDSNTTDSSTTFDYKVTDNDFICDIAVPSDNGDNGYLPDDADIQATIPKKNLPPPACFKTCLQCRKENPNPYFQYCFTCFRFRMEYFESKPNPKQKKMKHFNIPLHQIERNSPRHSQEPSLSKTSKSGPIGISSEHLSQKQNNDSKEKVVKSHTPEILGNMENICNICFALPKNGVFNHGKIGHIYCCYPCAKQWQKKSNKCPICNIKIRFVTKMIVV